MHAAKVRLDALNTTIHHLHSGDHRRGGKQGRQAVKTRQAGSARSGGEGLSRVGDTRMASPMGRWMDGWMGWMGESDAQSVGEMSYTPHTRTGKRRWHPQSTASSEACRSGRVGAL